MGCSFKRRADQTRQLQATDGRRRTCAEGTGQRATPNPDRAERRRVDFAEQGLPADPAAILSSLEGAFSFRQASADGTKPGLWVPQIGAIHAVLGYWTTEAIDPATIVMPTGTGKTEAMIGLFAARRPERLSVVVPSEAVREQIAAKFELLGVLQKTGVIEPPPSDQRSGA